MPNAEFSEFLESFKASQSTGDRSIEEARAGWEAMAARFEPAPDVSFTAGDADGVPVEWVSAPGVSSDRVVFYLHGGGYTLGSTRSYREFAGRISRASHARVLTVEYRLAPEHPFPAAIDDSAKAYRWLVQQNGNAKGIVAAGDSAGGGLVLATLLTLRDTGNPLPAGAVCISPSTDLAKTGNSIKTRAHLDPIVSVANTYAHAKRYMGEGADMKNPLASPLYAQLHGLPPLLVMVGTREILFDDSARLVDKARAAGVDVSFEVGEDMVHIWPFFAAILPEGQLAVERIGKFVRAHTWDNVTS